jgi:HTH-type transcriptional regulator/antitoxin MqsA
LNPVERELDSCPTCGGALSQMAEEKEVRIGKRVAFVLDEFFRCRACDEDFYAPGQLDLTLRRASDIIRKEEGLLTPAEIRGIRENMGLPQHAFEKLLGVGPKTVVRWEKGTVFQNGATDSLLRIVAAYPECALHLARLHEVVLPDPIDLPAVG